MTRTAKRRLAIVAAVLIVAAAARIAAPYAVADYVNRQIATMGEYRGHIASVELNLLRGGYALHDLRVTKLSGAVETPFIAMPLMELSLQWRALFQGRAVGEAVMHDPVVNLVRAESDEGTQLGAGTNWPEQVRDLFPFQLNRVEAENGLVTFRAPGIETGDSLTVRNFRLELRNLTNVQRKNTEAFADIDLDGRVMGNAPLKLTGKIDPNEKAPTFDLDLSIENAKLVDMNPWLRRFLKVDAEAGQFSMYSELAAVDNHFEGYVKPILENPKIFDSKEDASGPFQKAWEALVGAAAKILENRREKQVATEIPLRGNLEDPKAGVLVAIVNLGRNAFIAAFAHSLEGTITLRRVAKDVRSLNDGNDSDQDSGEARKGSRKDSPKDGSGDGR